MNQFYAHSTDLKDMSDWQRLDDHLNNVSETAGKFAQQFGGEQWAAVLGQYHDLGKGSKAWQAYLRHANQIVDEFVRFYEGHPTHAFSGAKFLNDHSKDAGKLMAYCIAGHHGGLPDWNSGAGEGLHKRLGQKLPDIEIPHIVPVFPDQPPITIEQERMGFQFQFFTRMIFSCLVDADFLDTEKFLDRNKSEYRSALPCLDELHEKFWVNFNKLRKRSDKATKVNIQREKVLEDCLKTACEKPGVFSLTVPTGGGKTLASLAFALSHAKHFLDTKDAKTRIIYVIPFTSIIEQNARVFRDMLGEDAVLEHHCNFFFDDGNWKMKLASENWDAPIIVTTNVQFFDSFFANRTSKCRKLHNVANSIIIFDEIQAIPVENLKPCLEVIKELSLNYGVTSVLCTATQPAIEYAESFTTGLKDVKPIIQDVESLFSALKRTQEKFIGQFEEQEIAAELFKYDQVLCIVNTRQQALDIYNSMPESDENIHLSALMYPAHRSAKLVEIRQRLSSGKSQPCRVVSTQLIEAGVDVDFPCVFRKVAGIDSIAQAAGRCNRNGKYKEPQKVFVFDLPEKSKCLFFRKAVQSSVKLFDRFKGSLTSPECVNEYFSDFFWKNEQNMDQYSIMDECKVAATLDIQFKKIADFKMINSIMLPVIIALEDEAVELVKQLTIAEYTGKILRHLQQFCVQVYPYQLEEIQNWLEQPIPGVWVLRSDELYKQTTGLKCREPEGGAFFV